MGYIEIRRALLKRLDITLQALYQRTDKLKAKYGVTTEEATFLLAQREGMPLKEYTDKETVAEIVRLYKSVSWAPPGSRRLLR